jgi:O-antigen/teichoic acid export membrane protein
MRKLLSSFLTSEGLRQSFITIVGNTFATGLSAVALILISRLLGPVQFGEFSVGFAIIMILNKLNDAGLNAANLKFGAQLAESKEAVNRVFSYTLKIKLVLSVIIIAIGLLVSPWLVALLHFSQPQIIYLAFILSVASTWYEQLLSMLQAVHRFTQAVVVNALQSGTKLIGILLLYFLHFGQSMPIFVLYMLAPLVPILFSWKLLPQWVKLTPTKNLKKESHFVWQLARHSAIGFIAAGLIENLDVLFVQKYLSSYETGLLSGVSRIAMMLLLVAYSLGNVLYPRVAKYQEKAHVQNYLKKASMLALLSIGGFIAFLPFAHLVVLLTIGPEYLPGAFILNILAAASFLTIATVPFLALFYSFKADWYFSVSGLIQLAITVVGNIVFVPRYGLEASAWTRLTSRLFLFFFTFGLALWLYREKYVIAKK